MTPPPSGLANAAGSLSQEMAAASSICQISPTGCQARTRLYRDGKLELEGFPVADISDHLSDGSCGRLQACLTSRARQASAMSRQPLAFNSTPYGDA
jgi:hypothetical protein